METKFQTSFIPKRPLVSEQKATAVKAGTSILMVIGTILFLVSVAGAVFSVIWINILNKDQESYKKQLVESQKRFDTALIEELKKINTKIDLSKKLLKNHISAGEVFSIISQLTVENVRFSNFTFAAPAKEGDGVRMTLSGTAKDPYAIAFQSDVFGESEKYGKNRVLKDPVMSDVSESEGGNIRFSFGATIKPEDLLYEKLMTVDTLPDNASTTTP